ncbi:MAG: sensor histidine kinase N-terminal domain-containing protein [Rhizobiales bacterium]|nr:sensor histidine kinase N-terminal domain-containing protein [Hyphomicrobiales bacterium]
MTPGGDGSWSLERHLVFTLGAVLGGLWLMAAAATVVLIQPKINEVFDSSLQETAQRLLPLAVHDLQEVADGDHDKDDGGESLSKEFDDSDAHLVYQVRDAMGNVLLRSHDAPAAGFPVALRRGFSNDGGLRIYTETSRSERIFVQVADREERRALAVREVLALLALPFLALIVASVVAVKVLLRNATRPLLKLREDLLNRGEANLSPLPPGRLPTELRPIVEAINRLMARLERLLQSERAFAANSAHELRTPLAAARAQTQLLVDDLKERREGARALNILGLLDRLSRLVEKLLQLSRAEAGVGMSGKCKPQEVVRIIVDGYGSRLYNAVGPVQLTIDPHADSHVAIDQDALGIILHNLIDNALAHGTAGEPVHIAIGSDATISIVNRGPVISPDHMPKLRERFSRGETDVEGSGLGLSIVDTIMRQAGGRMDLYSPARGRADGFEVVLMFRPAT